MSDSRGQRVAAGCKPLRGAPIHRSADRKFAMRIPRTSGESARRLLDASSARNAASRTYRAASGIKTERAGGEWRRARGIQPFLEISLQRGELKSAESRGSYLLVADSRRGSSSGGSQRARSGKAYLSAELLSSPHTLPSLLPPAPVPPSP